MAEGKLIITGAEPTIARPGEQINLIIHTKNDGGSDNFKVEIVGMIDISVFASQVFSLAAGLTKDVIFPLIMPEGPGMIGLRIDTYHYEGGWVWDFSSRWDVDSWY